MLGGTRGGRTGRAGFPFGAGSSEYRIHDALNLSTDDARRRHVAIDDAVEQARILIALLKVATARGDGTLFTPSCHRPSTAKTFVGEPERPHHRVRRRDEWNDGRTGTPPDRPVADAVDVAPRPGPADRRS